MWFVKWSFSLLIDLSSISPSYRFPRVPETFYKTLTHDISGLRRSALYPHNKKVLDSVPPAQWGLFVWSFLWMMCSLSILWLPPTVKDILVRLHHFSKLALGMNCCLSLCVSSVTDWVQGVLCLLPCLSLDRLQPHGYPDK